jgi:hypothetical protein
MELHESQPIGLTREMLGIEETGAVVKGRAKSFYIQDEWQKKYKEGYHAGYNQCELDYMTNPQEQKEHMHKARVNVLRACLEDIIKTLDSSPSELTRVLDELMQAEVNP